MPHSRRDFIKTVILSTGAAFVSWNDLLSTSKTGGSASITSSTPFSTGSYTWAVPSGLSGFGFRMKVKSLVDTNLYTISNSFFSIQASGGLGKALSQRYAGRAGMVPLGENPIFLQAAPNPFNPVTQVSFTVPDEDASDITEVRVFDMMARDVTTLVKDIEPAGRHTITFNASALPSGQYIVAVHTLNHMQSKLLILKK